MRRAYPALCATVLLLTACATQAPMRSASDADSAAPVAGAANTHRDDNAAPGAAQADALLAEGDRLRSQGRCAQALPAYAAAARLSGPEQGRALAATYLCLSELQRIKAAETAFGRYLEQGMAQGLVPLRLLFEPGRIDYLKDARVSSPYPMWLRELARLLGQRQDCLMLTGHAGTSATEQAVPELGLQRAQAVQRQLEALAPTLAGRIAAEATADAAVLIGTGSDDLRDALDRRVEFQLRPC
jgi:outer membrane protein OmpA-like peptidoglycan-associated protein